MTRGQAERLMPLLDELMAIHGLTWVDLDAIGVGVGPGNFTGVRISVSAARGLAMGLGIPAISVSLFEVLRGPDSPRDTDPELVVLQSQRAGLYTQFFTSGRPAGTPEPGANGYAAWSDIPAPSADRIRGAHATEIAKALTATGQGVFTGTDGTVPSDGGAEIIARIAAAKLALGQTGTPPAPLYLRPADAAPSSDVPPVLIDG